MDLNKVMIIGRVTQNPEARTTPQGVTVTKFSIATNRVWKDQQGNSQEAVEFHNIVAWRRLGEICAQYLSKGRQVYIEGHLQTSNWDDKTTGQKRYRTEIIADNMIMLGNKGDTPMNTSFKPAAATTPPVSAQPGQEQQFAPENAVMSDEEIRIEDIPF